MDQALISNIYLMCKNCSSSTTPTLNSYIKNSDQELTLLKEQIHIQSWYKNFAFSLLNSSMTGVQDKTENRIFESICLFHQ